MYGSEAGFEGARCIAVHRDTWGLAEVLVHTPLKFGPLCSDIAPLINAFVRSREPDCEGLGKRWSRAIRGVLYRYSNEALWLSLLYTRPILQPRKGDFPAKHGSVYIDLLGYTWGLIDTFRRRPEGVWYRAPALSFGDMQRP